MWRGNRIINTAETNSLNRRESHNSISVLSRLCFHCPYQKCSASAESFRLSSLPHHFSLFTLSSCIFLPLSSIFSLLSSSSLGHHLFSVPTIQTVDCQCGWWPWWPEEGRHTVFNMIPYYIFLHPYIFYFGIWISTVKRSLWTPSTLTYFTTQSISWTLWNGLRKWAWAGYPDASLSFSCSYLLNKWNWFD